MQETSSGYFLATVNASLNALSAMFLLAGFWFIRQKNIRAHRRCMLLAFGVSVIFLISYLTRFYLTGVHRFQGPGWLRNFYFGLLGTHTLLAAMTPILAIITIRFALKGKIDSHRKMARITFPIWLYVSVTGVIVYWMLYHL